MNEEEEAAARIERLRLGIQELLDLCASNNVEVPERLKETLLDPSVCRRMSGQADAMAAHHEKLQLELLKEDVAIASEIRELLAKLKATQPEYNVVLKNGNYKVTNFVSREASPDEMDHSGHRRAKQKIRTVSTESPLNKVIQWLRGNRTEKVEKVIFQNANLYLEAGKLYLVLGSPGSGKSTLLKMISQGLHLSKNHEFEGKVSVCGIEPTKDIVWTNLVGYIDQIDRLHPFLTVEETCKFAWLCRSGGTHHRELFGEGADVEAMVAQMDQDFFVVKRVLELLGLARVKDTFVGDSQKVRGVSGGERKRVTVAEMMVLSTPVCCMDEISTGLDAATTYDITRDMAAASRVTSSVRIVSLLQPPPETVANFDELILLSEGQIIYCGPVDRAIPYFEELGYEIPERMDAADWLQALPKDGSMYLKDPNQKQKHLTTQQFHEKFYSSEMGKAILENIEQQHETPPVVQTMATIRYRSTSFQSLKLLIDREFTLWWRDKYQIKAKIMQTVIMGTIVGTLYFQLSDIQSVVGVLFQSVFFVIVGGMTSVIKQFPARSIFYKQQDANFFPTWCYIAGRSLASIPNALMDATIYGTAVYFLAGLAHNDGATIGNFFLFWLLLFTMSLTSGLFFGFFSAGVQTLTVAQACMALTAILFVLFSGFTVQPDVIPNYYIWLYYLNFTAWALRGLVVNEFDSGKYDSIVPGTNFTEGQMALVRFGFTDESGDPYTREWAWYALLFATGSASVAVMLTTYFLNNVRFATGQSLVTDHGDEEMEVPQENVQIPFPRVSLTFENVHYVVQSSITNEKLELLKGVDGVIEAGKMTALMGSSGAGKTTLMDVLALRKSTGDVSGKILMNGHPQEEKSFRRCTGYVEQFDTQSPQLTIRETVEFSAQLRLDENTTLSESIPKFVDQVLYMLELTNLQDLQVGSDEEGGLSFEQRKRLSIAVEVAANPSILFLDEPTSGLDARAAAIVMRGMKRIASEGRAVCATIHQPSVAIFNDFDSLLLLKRGGEVVFHGDLGQNSENLIRYFERYDATPRIQPGENPATWMLTAIAYNLTRVMVSFLVAMLFASVYASQRVPKSESDMNSRVNSVFIATLFLCVNAQNTVLAVFEFERNMYYRHKAAGMYRPSAVAMAFTFCEIPFVLMTSTMYVIPFYFIMGFDVDAGKFFLFYLFVTLGFCSFTFLGQMFVSLLRDAETAQVIGGVLVSTTAMFSGIMTRPSEIPIFWIFMYWVTPGHYIFEGIFMSQYENDNTPIEASPGSPFFISLGCTNAEEICVGTAEGWVQSSFSDWSVDSIPWNILYLVVLVVTTRVLTFVGLKKLDYRAN
ncbi:hypothetical protein FisN_3Hh368 [Fistulifera solaris]|uniref:ABC transporter domain-containing protein n=1 Tax=Fistulifera solaris TaxID=1519565 RepID=A0A1Z5JQU8_FISSO|nr:hypothetical protein FisN_3Hh368 [Fistulifera solaris]|eukprot:GAX16151.1 hypothetical protein FisN_3Hh368 [Fistulifera solaris]